MPKYLKDLRLPDYIAIGLLLIYLLIGFHFVGDYGVNWDDWPQRLNGYNNWEFITGHDLQPLKASSDKYHGPAVEILLIAVEKAFRLIDNHDIYLARHRTVFILFVLSVGVFFLLCRKLFNSPWLALTAMLLLVLTPRIFGEAFYNPKDTTFLAAMILVFYTLYIFCEKPTFPHAIFHAFACAFAIDIRVIGILFIPITFVLIAVNLRQGKLSLTGLWKKLMTYIIAEVALMVMMWPILILNPWVHLWSAYKQLSNYVLWDGYNKYMGDFFRASKTPWHYHWVWMLITLPEVYILFFIAGVCLLAYNFQKKGFLQNTKNCFLLLSIVLFLFPLVFRSIRGSIVLDGWRHVYFVYPFFLIVAIYAIEQLILLKYKIFKVVAYTALSIAMLDSAIQIVQMHPFEYVYFNYTARAIFKPIDQKFEMDYWGVSYKQGLEYLLTHKQSKEKIKVAFQNVPGNANYDFLCPAQKEQILVSDISQAEYFLTNYRDFDYAPPRPAAGQLVYLYQAQGNAVMGIHKLR